MAFDKTQKAAFERNWNFNTCSSNIKLGWNHYWLANISNHIFDVQVKATFRNINKI